MNAVEIPCSLYGTALCEPLYLNIRTDGFAVFYMEHLRIWGLLLLNYFIQVLLVLELWRFDSAESMREMGCCNAVLLLQCMCIFLFELFMFTEISESINVFRLLYHAERVQPPDKDNDVVKKVGFIRFGAAGDSEGKESTRKKQGDESGAILVKRISIEKESTMKYFMRRIKRKDPPLSEKAGAAGARPNAWRFAEVTRCRKWAMVTVVALPKLLLSIAVAGLGGNFIVGSSSKEKLLLNTWTITFIVKVPEILFTAFTSPPVIEQLQYAEPVLVSNADQQKTFVIAWFFSSVISPFLVVLMSVVIVFHYKFTSCSDYVLPWAAESDFHWPWVAWAETHS